MVPHSSIHKPAAIFSSADFNRFSNQRVVHCFVRVLLQRKNLSDNRYLVAIVKLNEPHKFPLKECSNEGGIMSRKNISLDRFQRDAEMGESPFLSYRCFIINLPHPLGYFLV